MRDGLSRRANSQPGRRLVGFLSILLMNWIAIFGNMGQINQIRRLAAQPPAYQAYPPVGYPQPPYPQYPQTS